MMKSLVIAFLAGAAFSFLTHGARAETTLSRCPIWDLECQKVEPISSGGDKLSAFPVKSCTALELGCIIQRALNTAALTRPGECGTGEVLCNKSDKTLPAQLAADSMNTSCDAAGSAL